MNLLRRLLPIALMLGAAVQLVGCSTPMQAPSSTIENTLKLRNVSLTPVSVGSFALEQGKPAANDKSVSMRGSSLISPVADSFSKYLQETLRLELQAANLLDASSKTQVSGFLVESDLDAAIGTGRGSLSARFLVTKAGTVAYDRQLNARLTWDSSFFGAIAIPTAAQNYAYLYRKLVGTLFDDPDFRAALAP